MVVLIVNKILWIVIADYGTKPEKHGTTNNLLHVEKYP
jgi:hypothetical protein